MTATANIGLEELEVGQGGAELKINQSLITLDLAVAGYLSLSVAGSADVTLTDTYNGQAKYASLKLTGVLTGNINLLLPALSRHYLIDNATTGAHTITAKPVAGAGPVITQTAQSFGYCDGSVFKVVADSSVAAGTPFTTENAQDAVGAMVDTTLVYVDATPLLTRAALTGDVTAGQGSNALTIPNDTVTYAKMQNISATSRLLARMTAGAGDVEECTLSQVLDFIGSAAQGDILYRGTSAWTRLPAGTSGLFLQTQGAGANPQWAAGYTDEQAQDAIGAMVDASIVYVDATPLLTRAALTGDVTASQGGNATTIASQAVTYAKIQNVSATSRVLARKTAGAGSTEECTLSEVLDFVGSAAQGDILYRGSTGWVRLAAGTSGRFLQTQGASANPQWADAVDLTTTQTVTNKRVVPRTPSLTDANPVTGWSLDASDLAILTALSQDSMIQNPTGAPNNGELYHLRITSSAVRALTWDTLFSSTSITLPPATTGGGKTDRMGFEYNSVSAKLELIAYTPGA